MRKSATKNLVADFIKDAEGISCLEDLNDKFDLIVQKFNFNRYAYQLVRSEHYKGKTPLIIATYPAAWVDYYKEKEYQKIDPLILYGSDQRMPFTWDTLWKGKEISKQQSNFLHEAKEYSLSTGLSFPIRGINGSYASITMAAADDCAEGVEKLFKEHESTLHLLSVYYHAAACELLARTNNPVDQKPYIPLTEKELQLLRWAYAGKSYSDIAELENITIHGVDAHFRRIRNKLGVYSKQEAVVRSIRLKLISPDN